MNTATSLQPLETTSLPSNILSDETEFHHAVAARVETLPSAMGPRRIGYGLPCMKCKTYYAADLSKCPVCKNEERVSPIVDAAVSSSASLPEIALPVPDEAVLEEERERFLREFNASRGQNEPAMTLNCSVQGNHHGDFEPAAVCQACYVRLQERVDQLEAALHIDLVEATRVVYEAVWADPSDSTKTYQNAASAIMTELRKRAGIANVLGKLQPLAH
jgi:hypothetical protein